jgi:hypothetical protein
LRKAVGLPLLMLAWSLWRLLAAPQLGLLSVLSWATAATLVFIACRRLAYPRGLQIDPSGENLYVPGSWLTPALMVLIYIAHFASAVLHARHPALALSSVCAAGFALVYGSVSGLFFARTVAIWQLAASLKSHRTIHEFTR